MPGPVRVTTMLDALRALGEETRLRIVHLLRNAELTVSDLTEILGQSQPRVSRHVKLLVDAGIVERSREGAWVFVRLAADSPTAAVIDSVLAGLDVDDHMLVADIERLGAVRAHRTDDAHAYFERIAPIWDQERSLHASAAAVEAAILDVLGPDPLGAVCDLGTGTGRMLALLGPRSERAVGVDASHAMLRVARANVVDSDRFGHLQSAADAEETRIEFRQGDIYSPPLEPQTFDLVVVHQVLHYLDDPARAIHEAARLVAPGGRLLIVDFAPHDHDFLRSEHAHRRLGFDGEQVAEWMQSNGLHAVVHRHLEPPSAGESAATTDEVKGLTVSLWLGADPALPLAAQPMPDSAASSEAAHSAA